MAAGVERPQLRGVAGFSRASGKATVETPSIGDCTRAVLPQPPDRNPIELERDLHPGGGSGIIVPVVDGERHHHGRAGRRACLPELQCHPRHRHDRVFVDPESQRSTASKKHEPCGPGSISFVSSCSGTCLRGFTMRFLMSCSPVPDSRSLSAPAPVPAPETDPTGLPAGSGARSAGGGHRIERSPVPDRSPGRSPAVHGRKDRRDPNRQGRVCSCPSAFLDLSAQVSDRERAGAARPGVRSGLRHQSGVSSSITPIWRATPPCRASRSPPTRTVRTRQRTGDPDGQSSRSATTTEDR